MKIETQFLLIDQTDRKLRPFKTAAEVIIPPRGWINTIRNVMKMSLSQMGKRIGITAPSVKEIEEREVSGAISLNTLRSAGKALNLKLVYGFVPIDKSIRNTIDLKAMELAATIVLRTSHNMMLEDQGISETRIRKAIKLKTEEIKRSMPKALWD